MKPIICACIAIAAFSSQAHSMPTLCQDTTVLSESLKSEYKEQINGAGVDHKGTIVTLHVSPSSNSWTLVRSFPDGTSCLLAAGKKWRHIELPSTDPEA